jgi:hypothetical protein
VNKSQRDEYIHASVALSVRKVFERYAGVIEPLDRGSCTIDSLMGSLIGDGPVLEKGVRNALEYTLRAATVATGDPDTQQEEAWGNIKTDLTKIQATTKADHDAAVSLLVALSAVTAGNDANYDSNTVHKLVMSRLEEDEVWTSAEFEQARESMSELTELLTTPFMIQIIVTVSAGSCVLN